jgi:hypothetical protein
MRQRTMGRLAMAVAFGMLIGVLAAVPAGAASSFQGSSVGASSLSDLHGIVCPTTKHCVAIGSDDNGNGKSAVIRVSNGALTPWSGVLENQDPNAIACPDTTTCLTVSDEAVATVSVSTGAMDITSTLKPPKNGIVALGALACPTKRSCYAVGFEGPYESSVALIVHLSPSGRVLGKTKAKGTGIGNIACPSSSLCLISLATRTGESIERFRDGRLGAKNAVPSKTYIQAMTCYRAKVCFALAGLDSGSRTNELFPINPKTGSIGKAVQLGGFSGDGITCASATRCLIAGFTGIGSSAKTSVIVVTKGKPGRARAYPGESLSAVACATATVCYAVGLGASGAVVDRV